MKLAFVIFSFCFFGFCGLSANSAPIQISPGVDLLTKADWAKVAEVAIPVAGLVARNTPIGRVFTVATMVEKGFELAVLDGTTFRMPITAGGVSSLDAMAPDPPANVAQGIVYNTSAYSVPKSYSSAQSACSGIVQQVVDNLALNGYQCINVFVAEVTETNCKYGSTSNTVSTCVASPVFYNAPISKIIGCPTGYIASGNDCVYQYQKPETRKHIPDNFCDASDDIDCKGRDPRGSQTFYGTDENGPFTLDITPNSTASGNASARRRNQFTDNYGTSVVEDNIVFNSDGTVASTSRVTYPNTSISTVSTSPTLTPTSTSTNPTVTPSATTFPNDYAKDETLRLINTSVLTATSTMTAESIKIQNAINALNDAPASVEVPDIMNPPTGSFNLIKDSGMFVMLSGQTFANAGQCPVSAFDWNGRTFHINQHCPLIEDSWPIFQPVMIAIWILLGVFIVLRA